MFDSACQDLLAEMLLTVKSILQLNAVYAEALERHAVKVASTALLASTSFLAEVTKGERKKKKKKGPKAPKKPDSIFETKCWELI
mmetsp:Transcript_33703/g.49972  ORF Transcript_33703/g.49972 Transcript_33703/m.49972 type:complete len:85 (+) Transcript_33703:669-923(+)